MNKIEIEQLEKEINHLDNFFEENKIIEWIAHCVALFSKIKVNNEIISNFLKFFGGFRIRKNEMNFGINSVIYEFGPFSKSQKDNHYELTGSLYYKKIAFTSARVILKSKQEEEKLVPRWLIKELPIKKYSNLISSLELIEKSYQDKSADGLVKNSLTLLDSILNLDNKLKEKEPRGKLNCLIDNKNEREKFGVSRDFVTALNNNRVIRNEEVIHKDLPIKYNIPFLVSLSFAHLVLLFLEITITTGKIIE
ncbi:MAG: hypothetical protein P1P85_05385 [Patescibacteria group bacterium]|nr:hypothetical protein [Patescibacteria group bacterium]